MCFPIIRFQGERPSERLRNRQAYLDDFDRQMRTDVQSKDDMKGDYKLEAASHLSTQVSDAGSPVAPLQEAPGHGQGIGNVERGSNQEVPAPGQAARRSLGDSIPYLSPTDSSGRKREILRDVEETRNQSPPNVVQKRRANLRELTRQAPNSNPGKDTPHPLSSFNLGLGLTGGEKSTPISHLPSPEHKLLQGTKSIAMPKISKIKRGLASFVNGEHLSVIADTGSTQNIVSAVYAEERKLIIDKTSCSLKLGNSSIVQSMGTVNVDYAFAEEPSKVYKLTCHVLLSCIYDMILGNAFLVATETFSRYRHRLTACLFSVFNMVHLGYSGNDSQLLVGLLWDHLVDDSFAAYALPDTGAERNVMDLKQVSQKCEVAPSSELLADYLCMTDLLPSMALLSAEDQEILATFNLRTVHTKRQLVGCTRAGHSYLAKDFQLLSKF